jgi:hypothetical protein
MNDDWTNSISKSLAALRDHERSIMPARLEVINGMLSCVRPILFNLGIEDAPYSVHGTRFVATYGAGWYFITSGHSLYTKGSGALADEVCICPDDDGHCLPIRGIISTIREGTIRDYEIDISVGMIDMPTLPGSVDGDLSD